MAAANAANGGVRSAGRAAAGNASLCELTLLTYPTLPALWFARFFHEPASDPAPALTETDVEQSIGGPLGTLVAGLGLGGYYAGLIWINMLLGLILTPFFIIPITWLQDARAKRKAEREGR